MPILDPHSLEFISRSADQTRRVGMRLGALLRCGDLICLIGDLGSGKTTLAQGIASGWGSLDQVTSPSFVLMNIYRGSRGQQLCHLDAYRLNSPDEAIELDLDPILERGPMVVEWAERIQEALPEASLTIKLRWIDKEQRDMVFAARGKRYEELLATFRRRIYGAT